MAIKWVCVFELVFIIIFCSRGISYSDWQRPVEIVSGTWGSGETQFGIEQEDSFDTVPGSLCVSGSGNVYVRDGVNMRIKAYSSIGALASIIKPINIERVEDWPGMDTACDLMGNVYTLPYEKKMQKYSTLGQLLWEKQNLNAGKIFILVDNSIILSGNRIGQTNEAYLKYSPTGELLKTYSERPLELGEVKEKYLGIGKYKYTIKYPDKTWEIIREGAFSSQSYMRDMNGNLYGIGSNYIVRYDDQGNELAKLTMPQARFQGVQLPSNLPSNAELPRPEVLEAYGPPVLAPNGDVYTWKRTPDKYYIIKWVWQ